MTDDEYIEKHLLKNDMQMKKIQEGENTVVEIDLDKIETHKYQENDYNAENIMLDHIKFKCGQIIRDFDLEAVLTLAFPYFFVGGAYDFSINRKRPLTFAKVIAKIMKRFDNLVEFYPKLIMYL